MSPYRCLVIILLMCLSGCSFENKYQPDAYFSDTELDEMKWKIIHYLAKAPEKRGTRNVFDKDFDDYYRKQANAHRVDLYYIDRDTRTNYFLISRQAPSLIEKRVATGGYMKFDDQGNLVEYEEVFRTWKMVPDTLARRASMLFDKMVHNQPLELYYTKNSNGVDYIEFPDDHVTYDKSKRAWITTQSVLQQD